MKAGWDVLSETSASAEATGRSPAATRLARPRWRDVRLLGGVLLVLVSVVLGARVLAAADDTVAVWAAAGDLGTGSVLQAADLRSVQVRLGDEAQAYVSADAPPPVGWVLLRPVGAGELLPVSAASATPPGPVLRQVTVAVERFHAPTDLARGHRVDVYVTPDDGQTYLVVGAALVQDLVEDGGRLGPSGSAIGVALGVAPTDVQALVQAAQDGPIDLVRVPAS